MVKLYKFFSLIIVAALLLFNGCADDANPGLEELISPTGPPPVLTSIDPPGGGLAGVTVLTINGSNFSTVLENNTVLFDNIKGEILEASATQLKVKPPVVISDSVKVKVEVFKVEDFSNELSYKLEAAVEEIYPFDPNNAETPNGITVDGQENVYASLSGLGIKKVDPAGNLTDWAPKGAETFFNSLNYGPSNIIYATRRVRGILQAEENTTPAVFISSAGGINENTNDTDFDQNLNIWAAAANSLFRATLAKDVKKFSLTGNFKALKVTENFIYAISTTNSQEILWKIPLISADSIGTPEEYFNFTQSVDPFITVNDLAVAQDGDIYLATSATADPIYIVHPDKTFEALYPGVISSSASCLAWGNDVFLYMTRDASADLGLSQTVLRINMQKTGVPYYGRQ